MSDTVEQVKARLSIVDVVSGYVKLERAGARFRARCPFHSERTPSFIVSPERGTYHCFGCGVGGDVFSFIEAIEGVDFKGALKMLAEKAGVPLVYDKNSSGEGRDEKDRLRELMEAAAIFYAKQLNDDVKKYLSERGLNETSVKAFRIGFAPAGWHEVIEHLKGRKFNEKEILDAGLSKKGDKGSYDRFRSRIMFPIADSAGRTVAFSGRIFGADQPADSPKYINSPETILYRKSAVLYGFDRAKTAIRKHNFATLVEGQMDLVSVHQAGWGNAVAVSGTAFTQEHAALIKRMTDNLVIAFDADEAGIKAAARAARAALAAGLHVKIAQLTAGLDPADLILKEGEEAWKKCIREAKDIVTFLLDTLEARTPQADKFRRAVELAVLPFLAEVQSPIERDAYVREVASRLGVSEGAVTEALEKIPSTPVVGGAASVTSLPRTTRAKQAAGILLWQESLKKPDVDIKELAKDVARAIGREELSAIRALPASAQEALRFGAESLFSGNGMVERDIKSTLAIMERERLSEELAETTGHLKRAENAGDDAETARLMEHCKLLTGEIARLSEAV